MCDYSLMGVPNRLAREGEDLVVCRFKTGSLGLTPSCCTPTVAQRESLWVLAQAILNTLGSELAALIREPIAACVPPGARLMLNDIPPCVQQSCSVGPIEEVIFTQLTAKPYEYRDAVRFRDGHEMLVQELKPGQRVRVLQLSLTDEEALLDAPNEALLSTHTTVDFIASRSFGLTRRERERRHD